MNATQQLSIYRDIVFEPDDIVEYRLFDNSQTPKVVRKWGKAKDLPAMAETLEAYNDSGLNIYIGVNPRIGSGLSGDANVSLARCLFCDFDHITPPDGVGPTEAVLGCIEDAELPKPDLLINSGHGIHCYWRLDKPLTDLQLWKQTQEKLNAKLDADPAIKNPERIMRLPGFQNVKERPFANCYIVRAKDGV